MSADGVMAYSVRRRTRELGTRVALGASRTDIIRLVMKEGGVIACEAGRHPFPPMHPEVRRGLIDIARRLDPLVLHWAR